MSQQSNAAPAFVHPYGPEKEKPVDTMPSEYQPPGTDEDDDMPQSLEEALLGE